MIFYKASGEFLIFILKWFFINLALVANFKVDKVSSKLLEWVEQVTSSEVLKFPPKLSYRILVNLESL